ncbi:acetylornithine aminotransferase/ornithine--oxo-acid transaminase [Lentzea xinjiangensis]|uniref:Acetylornithine aminotransferase/ornithine--oxo-acid transaminase n=1 Tax=Lentzea xinjiangensis TaxID=402600 RepID=A0A1H9SZ18_9PSEU|nr:aminotransferase class III-fold pyridoxal phosphate-dependent enzyme [Lentzea xinjiangensis]SER90131.1 acetylornithine aminotransferase/ornithine--oxo-acid transaminase [Lentzea xinjiangensis]
MTVSLGGADLRSLRFAQEHHLNHYGRARLPFSSVRASGVEIEMADLSRDGELFSVIDASGGYGSACLGAGHPAVRGALDRGLGESGYVTDEVGSLERARLLERLLGAEGLWRDHFPEGRYRVSGRNSGSEGVELALRLVLESRFDGRRLRYRPERAQRDTILVFEGAWHGWTDGLLPLLNRRHYRVGLPGLPTGEDGLRVEHVPFGDVALLRDFFAANAHRLLAVFVEPVQGDAGILLPPPGYLRTLADLCVRDEVLLVADEVLTFAKTGRFFAMVDEGAPVHTDITVIGKSLGMGALSTSMVFARSELGVRATGAVATSDLRPLTCAVINDGLAHIVAEGLLEQSKAVGEHLSHALRTRLVRRFPEIYAESRGIGVLHGVELTGKAAGKLGALRTELVRAGVYVEFMAGAGRRSHGLRYVHPAMRIAPPLVTTADQADLIVDRLCAGTRVFEDLS